METLPFAVAQYNEEQRQELNKKLAKRFAAMMAIKIGVSLGLVVAAHLLNKKLDEMDEDPQD